MGSCSTLLLLLLTRACLSLRLPGLDDGGIQSPLEENQRNYIGFRLPGLEDETSHIGNQPAYLPFANARVIHADRQPTIKNALSSTDLESYTGLQAPSATTPTIRTTKAPTLQDNDFDHRMEQLLDKIFGTDNWKTLLQENPATDTTTPLSNIVNQQNQQKQQNNVPSGFFGNEISAGNIAQPEIIPDILTPTDVITPTDIESLKSDIGNQEPSSKSDEKYTGSYINSQLHESDNAEPTTFSHLDMSFNNAGTITSNPIDTMGPFRQQASVNQVNQYVGDATHSSGSEMFNPNTANHLDSELFNPSAVNQLQSNYNPNQSPAIFNTQTGSNPLNLKWQLNFDADKVNTQVENNLPPGVKPDVSGDKVSNFDANQLNEALLDRDWQYSGLPSSLMSPAFLSGSEQRQGGTVAQTNVQAVTRGHVIIHTGNHAIHSAETSGISKTPQDVNKEAVQHSAILNHERANTTQINDNNPRFNFIPGSLYMPPGVSRTNQNQGQPSSHDNSAVPLFNPNAVNANQMVFNPNAISWIRPRTIQKRSRPSRKMIYNRTAHNDPKDTFGNVDTSHETNTIPHNPNGITTTDSNDSLTHQVAHALQTPSVSGISGNGGFNPNQANAYQGQNNFVPGQMADGSAPKQINDGGKDSPYMYSPNNANLNLLNFDIGSLLGVNSGKTEGNDAGIGMVGAFNPTSLNKMMMTSFTAGTNMSDGVGANFSQGSNTGFNPNTAPFVGGTGFIGSGSSLGLGLGIQSNSTNSAQSAPIGTGFMSGGFDANLANVGFGSVLKTNTSSGFGFGAPLVNGTSPSSSTGTAGFGMGGGFDPNAANSGFGSADYGMGGMNGPAGAFGGAFNADEMNAGFIGKGNISAKMNNLLNFFLGVKMKNEGRDGADAGYGGLYDPGYMGSFDPDSVNQVSYNPNTFNDIKINFNPSEMIRPNPGMQSNGDQLFDPDAVNSLIKQQSLNPNQVMQFATGKQQSLVAKNDNITPHQTGQPYGQTDTNTTLFDPFEVMKQLMGTSNTFNPGESGNTPIVTPLSSNTGITNASNTSPDDLPPTQTHVASSTVPSTTLSSTIPSSTNAQIVNTTASLPSTVADVSTTASLPTSFTKTPITVPLPTNSTQSSKTSSSPTTVT